MPHLGTCNSIGIERIVVSTPPGSGFLLLEGGGYLLLESGGKLIL